MTSQVAAPERYLRAVVVVARSAKPREYAVIHFGSSSFFRTDRLGAMAVRALAAGRSDAEAMELVERIEAGSGERARQLFLGLGSKGAMTSVPPQTAGRGWRLRRIASLTTGAVLGMLAPLVRLVPVAVLASLFIIPSSMPITNRFGRSVRDTIIDNLRASGYANHPTPELVDISRRCVADWQSNSLFMYLATLLSPEQLGSLVNRLFDRNSVNDLAARLQADGATVGAFLHGPLGVALPTVLRSRGCEVVRAAVPWTHGSNVSESSGPLSNFFGDSPDVAVPLTEPLASGRLLRHLTGGRSIYTGLDRLADETNAGAKIEMLGHSFPRSDGPAWLAERSGRPLALWTTHSSRAGVVVTASPLIHPDRSLPVELRVAAMSERLYAYAEAAIREHPEAWVGWSYLSRLTGRWTAPPDTGSALALASA